MEKTYFLKIDGEFKKYTHFFQEDRLSFEEKGIVLYSGRIYEIFEKPDGPIVAFLHVYERSVEVIFKPKQKKIQGIPMAPGPVGEM